MPETLFFNMWRCPTAADQRELLAAMQEEAPALSAKPGFLGLTAWASAGGHIVIVRGRWESRAAFDAAIANDAAAQAGRERLARHGTPSPDLFTLAFEVGPAPQASTPAA